MHRLNHLINTKLSEIINIRHQLHQIPELKFEEIKTSSLIMETLSSYGIPYQSGIAKTGVIGIIDSGKPGKTVALRADMDALPIQEITPLPYQSKYENKMHACGHDGHTASLLLTAYLLEQMKDQFQGKVKLIFQPAEEGGKGSTLMINEGVLENPTVDAIFGWHIWPGIPLGNMGTRVGTLLAGNGRFEISIHGQVAHMSMPDAAINPVTIGASLITTIDRLREKYRDHFSVINIIRFECGEMKGGMTDFAKIIGVYFVENNNLLSKIKADIQIEIDKTADSVKADIQVHYQPFHMPTINTQTETELAFRTAHELLPTDKIIEFSSVMTASEDFSEYLSHVPGCFFLIGAGVDSPQVHTNQFDFPDDVISNAALIMCQIAMNYLNGK
jgi:amidohydrolase